MVLGKLSRWFYLLFMVALLLAEFYFNLNYYIADPGEEQCDQGYIVRNMSPRSGSVRFRLINYDFEFESNSINRNVGEKYSVFIDGEFKPNHEVNLVCYFSLRSFIFFEEKHVFYFGNNSYLVKYNDFVDNSAAEINSSVIRDFVFYIFLFVLYFTLIFKFVFVEKV